MSYCLSTAIFTDYQEIKIVKPVLNQAQVPLSIREDCGGIRFYIFSFYPHMVLHRIYQSQPLNDILGFLTRERFAKGQRPDTYGALTTLHRVLITDNTVWREYRNLVSAGSRPKTLLNDKVR